MYECPSCGGNLKFDIPSQQLLCGYCQLSLDPNVVQDNSTLAEDPDYFRTNIFKCPQCGGEMISGDNEATAFCSYCGTSNILSSRIVDEKRPSYIIPFKKTKEDCKKAFANKMRYAFFVPKEYKNPAFIDSFRGIYMPYFSYRLSQKGFVSLNGSISKRRGDYIYTDHYHLKGNLDATYNGYSFDASSTFYDNISESLAPYHIIERVPFTPSYLSGFYADTADVSPDLYFEDAAELANENTYKRLKKSQPLANTPLKHLPKVRLFPTIFTQRLTV